MACAKCTLYRPKASGQGQLLECRANLVRMRQEMPLSEDELAAVEDGIGAVEKLLNKLENVPAPERREPAKSATLTDRRGNGHSD